MSLVLGTPVTTKAPTLSVTTIRALNKLAFLCCGTDYPTKKRGVAALVKAGLAYDGGSRTWSNGQSGASPRKATIRVTRYFVSPTAAGKELFGALVASLYVNGLLGGKS
jgi:hypothetical protein